MKGGETPIMAILTKNWLMILLLGTFAAGGAVAVLFALPASATDRSVEVRVECEGSWTGTLQWTLDGVDIGGPVGLDCPNGGDDDFEFDVTVPVSGAEHANDYCISVTSPVFGVPVALCVFRRDFDPNDLETAESENECESEAEGERISNSVEIETR